MSYRGDGNFMCNTKMQDDANVVLLGAAVGHHRLATRSPGRHWPLSHPAWSDRGLIMEIVANRSSGGGIVLGFEEIGFEFMGYEKFEYLIWSGIDGLGCHFGFWFCVF
nr:hypothetical protein CFP56_51625 [Quercus suber]